MVAGHTPLPKRKQYLISDKRIFNLVQGLNQCSQPNDPEAGAARDYFFRVGCKICRSKYSITTVYTVNTDQIFTVSASKIEYLLSALLDKKQNGKQLVLRECFSHTA